MSWGDENDPGGWKTDLLLAIAVIIIVVAIVVAVN